MLAYRVIPQLLIDGRKLVKGQKFAPWRSVGVPQQAVRIHQMREVDELMILDVTATKEGRGPDLDLVQELAEVSFSPLAVGGGVKTLQDIRDLLNHGADKVVICTAALQDKRFICEAAMKFGSSTLVGCIDAKLHNGVHLVYIKCGTHPLLTRPYQAAEQMQECGIGEILVQSIDREGTLMGYDRNLIQDVSYAVDVPVVAAGGCSSYADMHSAIMSGADAVAAGALFQFTDSTPKGGAKYLQSMGLEARCN